MATAKGMTVSEGLSATELRLPSAQDGALHQSQFVVYHDAPRLLRGIIPVAALPRAIRALHVKDDTPGLTFVFDARAAGLRASVLWDSGAAPSFVDSAFVKRHILLLLLLTAALSWLMEASIQSPRKSA